MGSDRVFWAGKGLNARATVPRGYCSQNDVVWWLATVPVSRDLAVSEKRPRNVAGVRGMPSRHSVEHLVCTGCLIAWSEDVRGAPGTYWSRSAFARALPRRHFVEHLACTGCVRGIWSRSEDVRGVAEVVREVVGRDPLLPMVLGNGSRIGSPGQADGSGSRAGLGLRFGLGSLWAGSVPNCFYFIFVLIKLINFN